MSFALLSGEGTGFLARAGDRVRLLAWLPSSAFRVLPWEAPGPADIMSALAPGLADVRLTMPWEEIPSAWMTMDPAPPAALPPSREEPFVVRVEGTMKADRVPLALPVGKQTLHVAAVWREPKADPAPSPQSIPAATPTTNDAPRGPSSPSPSPPASPSPRPAPRTPPADPLPPPKTPRAASALPWVLGLGAVVAAVTFLRAPVRRAR